MKRLLHSSCLLFALSAATPLALAAPVDATAEARQRFNEGIVLADAGDHEAARLKFNQAWVLLKNPAVLYNLARAEQLSGHLLEALEHYRLFGKMAADPKIDDKQRQRAADNLAELTKKLGQIDVEGAPSSARVSVDGRVVDTGSGELIVVLPGKHVVEMVAEGKVRSVTVDCAPGTVTKARFDAPGEDRPPTAAKAPAAEPPPASAPVDRGPPFWTTGRAVGAAAVGAGLVAVGVGVGFHFVASGAEDDAASARAGLPEPRSSACAGAAGGSDACRSLRDTVDDQRSAEGTRNVLLVGGGALAIGGAVLFALSPPKSEPARGGLRFVPAAGAGGAGFLVRGAF